MLENIKKLATGDFEVSYKPQQQEIADVKLISYSTGIENPDDDLLQLVAYCARVSNPANQDSKETSEKLIRYLIKNQHWSPLEMVSICLEITTTRDIARQILRHRSFSFQEFSQRYADPVKELKFVLREARRQDTKNRQNSLELDIQNNDADRFLAYQWERMQENIINQARDTYRWAIEAGIAKEQARAVLPEGLTESKLYMNGTLRSWIHYIQLRAANGTQKEHILIAKECAKAITKIFPMAGEFVPTDS
ncbi:MAG: FAD-dependent thymidylate synthase [Methylococcales bacterium]